MKDPTGEALLKQAEKLNDGVLPQEKITENDAISTNKVFLALQKINQISNNIRSHTLLKSHQMQQGDQWAHLTIEQKIGQGGIGEVYCAYDPILDSSVAVKFLSKKSQLYISQKQFLEEARFMAKVRHPHVLAIHGATVDQHMAGYWSDYLDGMLLNEKLNSNTITWTKKINCAQQLVQAVKAIHNNQLVHGDIKASNIMIQPQRGAILLDFGSSSSSSQSTSNDFVQQASPMAMAPEQFNGQRANSRSDIFALGLVFWQLTTSNHPLQNLELEAIKNRVTQLENKSNILSGPQQWKKLIVQMIAVSPDQRPDILQVEKVLQQLVDRPARKAKQLAVAAVLLLAAGITSVSLYSRHKTSQAQQETQAMNTLLSDILMKSSPIEAGKDVLLVDVLKDAEKSLLTNQKISDQQKTENLIKLVRTYRHQGKHQMSIDLASQLLLDPEISDSHRLELLMQKSAGLNENKNYQESEALLLEAIKLKPITDQDATVQLSALTTLIYTYNESYQLEKVPPLIAQAKTLWQRSDKKEAALANIYLVEGNHYEIKEQYPKAYLLYQKAITNFIIYYGEKNLDVLIAKGAAATVLTYDPKTINKGTVELQKVVDEMTDFLGKEHTSTLIARINLADAYAQTGKPQKALNSIVPFMPYVYEAYGKTGGMALTFKNMIAGYYQKNGEPQAAQNELFEILLIQEKQHGINSEPWFEAQLNLVDFFIDSNQITKGKELVKQMISSMANELSSEHRLMLDGLENQIWISHLEGDLTALTQMKRLIETKTNSLGPEDPSTLSAVKRLESILNSQPK